MEKTTTYTAMHGSGRSNHQQVLVRGKPAGEVWRESVIIPKSKARNPMKWRWLARASNDETVLGRGTRHALVLGAGFASKNKATKAVLSRFADLKTSLSLTVTGCAIGILQLCRSVALLASRANAPGE